MCTGTHPFIPAPNTASFEIICSIFGQRCENTFYLELGTPWTAADLFTAANALIAAWPAAVGAYMSNQTTLLLVKATALDDPTSPGVEVTAPPNTTGGQLGTALPSSAAFTVRFLTGLRGRSFRGRVYHYGLTVGQVSANQLSSSAADNIADAWASMILATASLVGAQHVVVSDCFDNTWRTVAVTTPVNAVGYSDLLVDSQRRRLSGRGS